MKKHKTYPAGFPLFDRPNDGPLSAKPVKGIPWPVVVFFDPSHTPHTLKKVQPNASPVDACTMCFRGTVNNLPVLVAADSQASTSFLDIEFARAHGLTCTPTRRKVQLADGTFTESSSEVSVLLRLPSSRPGISYTHKTVMLGPSSWWSVRRCPG